MRYVLNILVFLAFFSLFGAGMYYFALVNVLTLAISGIFAFAGTVGIQRAFPLPLIMSEAKKTPRSSWILFLLGVGLNSTFLAIALLNPITEPLRSPWLAFSPWLILLPTGAFLATLVLFRTAKPLSAVLGAFTAGTVAGLVAFLYPLGFGFDPYLHRAALAHIAEFGSITPKPLYYIGAYMLELGPHILFQIPLFFLDVLLAPLGLAVLVFFALRGPRALHPGFIALLPLGAFISTTPQAVGFLWVFALVLAYWNKLPLAYLILFALAACITHPLAGIPALLLVALAWANQASKRARTPLLMAIGALGVCALPGMFFAQQVLSGMNAGFSWDALTTLSRIPTLGFFAFYGNPVLDTLMLFGANMFFLTAGLAILAQYKSEPQTPSRILALGAIITCINFLILGLGFDFPFLISYERTNFSLRLITIASLMLLPLAYQGLRIIAHALACKDVALDRKSVNQCYVPTRIVQCYGFMIIAIVFTANVYTAYPRHDGYSRSAAFNATAADTEIVHAIARDAGDDAYVVLANQTMSAVAVQELGFFHYFPGDIFAYPIPTGGPLYAHFLTMIEHAPSTATITQVQELTGATRVYFVVHNYWWESETRIAETKKSADAWFTSADNSITVFMFTEGADVSDRSPIEAAQ